MRHSSPRIAFGAVSVNGGNGGIERVARMCVRALSGAGYDLELLSFLDSGSPEAYGVRGRGAGGGKARFLAMTHMAARRCDYFIYDHAGIGRAHPLSFGLRRPFATWMHGNEAWEALRADAERVMRRADAVFVNSGFTLERFEQLHQPLASAAVCALATETPAMMRAMPSGAPTALTLGRMDHEPGIAGKGHAELIECWPEIMRKLPDARLLIVGKGERMDEFRSLASGSPAAGNIEFRGFVPEREMEAIWRQTHVLAMPSRQEGFGIVYVESMARGVPVIASIHDAGREVNADGASGFNIDLDDQGQLKSRLIALLSDRDLNARLGRGARLRWERHFRYASFAERFLEQVKQFTCNNKTIAA